MRLSVAKSSENWWGERGERGESSGVLSLQRGVGLVQKLEMVKSSLVC